MSEDALYIVYFGSMQSYSAERYLANYYLPQPNTKKTLL